MAIIVSLHKTQNHMNPSFLRYMTIATLTLFIDQITKWQALSHLQLGVPTPPAVSGAFSSGAASTGITGPGGKDVSRGSTLAGVPIAKALRAMGLKQAPVAPRE